MISSPGWTGISLSEIKDKSNQICVFFEGDESRHEHYLDGILGGDSEARPELPARQHCGAMFR